MSWLTSSLPVLRRSSCSKRCLFTQRLFAGRRKCKSDFGINWKSRSKKFKGVLVTGASAATCALVYLSIKYQSQQDNVENLFKVDQDRILKPLSTIELTCLTEEDSEELDVLDLFYNVGFEDEWLACPLSHFVSQTRATQRSSAFIKSNLAELLTPWEQARSNDPWVLLQLTKSSNVLVRQIGVACLADKIDWDAYKYRNIAQACDYKTVIALARYPQASDSYFFPMPKLYPSKNDILVEVQSLLKKLPMPETVKCNISFYRSLALQKEILFQKDPSSMDLLTHFYTLPGEEKRKKDQALRYCLQALEAYSAEESYALRFIQLHGLAVLQYLYEEVEEEWIQMYILIILHNLSLISEVGKDLVCTGWIHELRKWSKGDNTTFSIMADTILANLDRDWMTSDLYKNMILLHPTQRNSQPVYADIVLVHGVRGGAVRTWRQRGKDSSFSNQNDGSYCWPKDWLSQEFQGARIISIGYNSSLHQWGDQCPYESERHTIEGRSEELIQNLLKAGVGTRPIIWMGHSMGGLLIKEIIQSAEKRASLHQFVENTQAIVMYSVPNKGSPVVDTMLNAKYILFPSVEVQEMSTSSSKLKILHQEFVRMVTSYFIPCLSFGERMKTVVGRPFPSLLIVPEESSDPGVGEYVSLDANHIETCKPCCKDDPMYIHTLKFLKDIIKNLQQ